MRRCIFDNGDEMEMGMGMTIVFGLYESSIGFWRRRNECPVIHAQRVEPVLRTYSDIHKIGVSAHYCTGFNCQKALLTIPDGAPVTRMIF